ncbi:unnamed protein product [Lota lota]
MVPVTMTLFHLPSAPCWLSPNLHTKTAGLEHNSAQSDKNTASRCMRRGRIPSWATTCSTKYPTGTCPTDMLSYPLSTTSEQQTWTICKPY